jgi:uncharacterized HhH-GPD family protein
MPTALHFTGTPEADTFLAQEPLALLIGFVLDQQVTVQKAFSGPLVLRERMGSLDAKTIAATEPGTLEEVFRERPAIHRFPAAMARRVHELCTLLAERYDGDAAAVWRDALSAEELERRLLELPGIGEMKARSLLAVLAKRFGVALPGMEEFLPDYACLADVDSAEALAAYQAQKRAAKAARRAAER